VVSVPDTVVEARRAEVVIFVTMTTELGASETEGAEKVKSDGPVFVKLVKVVGK
jgi:hypothetical protein